VRQRVSRGRLCSGGHCCEIKKPEHGWVHWRKGRSRGHFGKVQVGAATRSLSRFVLVLSWSRAMYARFTLDQTLETFLRGHALAFETLGGGSSSDPVRQSEERCRRARRRAHPASTRRFSSAPATTTSRRCPAPRTGETRRAALHTAPHLSVGELVATGEQTCHEFCPDACT
jgi:hypothetical protein